jgi:hypothetical protein
LIPGLAPPDQEYVTMDSWRAHNGRADLIDCVADDFERRVPAPSLTANY